MCDDDIDKLIEDGIQRSKNMQDEAKAQLKDKINMADFELNSVNLYQFEDVDYAKAKREEA